MIAGRNVAESEGGRSRGMKKPCVFFQNEACNLALKDKSCRPGCWAYASTSKQAAEVNRIIEQKLEKQVRSLQGRVTVLEAQLTLVGEEVAR
jgi:hypothetical protein